MSSSIYQPLPSEASIRLLEIQQGVSDSKIECRLVEVASVYDGCPTYEALSYVWGSPVKSKTIVCNDEQNFSITQSLLDALNHLRLPDRSRLIWADAICINQEDIDERNQQVRIMKDIYANARKVCVWLGLDIDGDVELAYVLMARIVQTCEVNARNRGRRLKDMTTAAMFKCSDLPLLGRYGDVNDYTAGNDAADSDSDSESVLPYWDALRNFFSRSWFTRVWCVQEIVVARNSIVMCGNIDIPWHVVEVTAMWVDSQQTYHDFKVPSQIEGVEVFNPLMMCQATNLELQCKSLISALRTFQDFQATDPRDKIYAILGIVSDPQVTSQILISYESPVARIYMETVGATLDIQKDLFVLACVQHPEVFEPDPSFPSWTPRWDIMVADTSILSSAIGEGEYEWMTNGDRKLDKFAIEKVEGILSLEGVLFDSVDFVSDKMDYKDFGSSSHPSKPSVVLSLWRRLVDSQATVMSSLLELMTFAFALTGETDVDYYRVTDFIDAEDRDQFYTDFFAYIIHLHDLEEEEGLEIEHVEKRLSHRTSDGEGVGFKYKPEIDTRPGSFLSEGGDWKRYETAASRMCDQKRFFTTSNGLMGMGPACIRQDDLVVVLFGGQVPFMLRKADSSLPSSAQSPQQQQQQSSSESECKTPCYYHLLGEAYVPDIMRGEVIEQMDEGKFIVQEFRIK